MFAIINGSHDVDAFAERVQQIIKNLPDPPVSNAAGRNAARGGIRITAQARSAPRDMTTSGKDFGQILKEATQRRALARSSAPQHVSNSDSDDFAETLRKEVQKRKPKPAPKPEPALKPRKRTAGE